MRARDREQQARSGMAERRNSGRRASGPWLLIALLLSACSARSLPYGQQIAAWHAEKDQFMRESSDSPVPPDRRATFPPLTYFPTDPSYRVPAVLEPSAPGPAVQMPTSTGQVRQEKKIGKLAFTLKGRPMTLDAFVEADQNDLQQLFVPFRDLTNGAETYAAGRYLELQRTATGVYDLDFNRAFFPFCFYNKTYDCPYPPPENRLTVPIRAGERLPHAER